MRTYITFKTSFVMEDYLTIKNVAHRKAMTKLRISAHSLAIERGRYTTPSTPIESRICPHCPDNVIEDELHFIMQCNKTSEARETLFNTIQHLCANFINLCEQDKFVYLLTADDAIAEEVAKFIFSYLP